MLTFGGRGNRREFLRVGGLGVAGLTLADLLRHDARAESPARPKSVIYVVLNGGPSHIDSLDPKPDAPDEIRGPFGTIPTALPGVRVTELLPRLGGMLDRLALVRGVRSVENDHFLSEVYSGLPRTSGRRPAFGSVVSRLAPGGSPLPPYVSLHRQSSEQFEFELPHYAGSNHAPYRPFAEALADLRPVASGELLDDRTRLLAAFDVMRREADRPDSPAGLDRFRAKALDIITSPAVRAAFDLSRESPKTLDAYGHGRGKYPHQTVKTLFYPWDAGKFVLARRLVEAGVRVVTLRAGDWDHHSGPESDIFAALRCLLPLVDRSVSALVDDLADRGLADDVLVVVLGEFGRTPKISQPGPGREHWADAGFALVSGGGLTMGQVVGETDSRGERSKSGAITFQNLMATTYHVLGVDPGATLPDFTGRPQYLLDDPQPVRELVG
ncbi:MAG: DUF1501 domain-containing protein [Gemmataceae bacterium]|nr:DUF1501 domain-containing protein [Gemmataceae bacterium]